MQRNFWYRAKILHPHGHYLSSLCIVFTLSDLVHGGAGRAQGHDASWEKEVCGTYKKEQGCGGIHGEGPEYPDVALH